MYLNDKAEEIHAYNRAAGWWDNPRPLTTFTALITSELCEAMEEGPDKHLPEYPTYMVELADAAIRILDMAGGMDIDLSVPTDEYHSSWEVDITEDIVPLIVYSGSTLFEYARKDKEAEYHKGLAYLYQAIWTVADANDIPLATIIDKKVEYNKNRADHKRENRNKPGGKKV